ncbi:MAG TPA: hydrogenase expression/formation protein HypE [Candidatus Marinimicrobia bacterium]|nr:hydrogenase expression/formation protein HypE [Candidatus Neomarinimicrobiota bacterium]HRS51306.1 hydrogenase expression/formation protein HypE [Candidatus Neomarinimicrobiota bacterium]HRU91456.1 hydrogenase expression/formation protein HypE [Candidatus Neomarinimicrobiota bacterium]
MANNFSDKKKITSAHGAGGKYSHDLIKQVFLKHFDNPPLRELLDAAILPEMHGRLVFTTDSHVVQPLFFPGGDIGQLAVSGTVNDLAVCGAKPLWLSCGMIIEEGFNLDTLEKIVISMQKIAQLAGVQIVTGDTKVVGHSEADGLFINTAGIGYLPEGRNIGKSLITPGDKILINGFIGDHAAAIIKARQQFQIDLDIISDCAPLNELTEILFEKVPGIRIMRDPTRGGVATTLNEFMDGNRFGIRIIENSIPVRDVVLGLCEPLGFDPLYLANEGKVVVIVAEKAAEEALTTMRSHPLGRNAAIIGEVIAQPTGHVLLKTRIGTERVLDMLTGEMLPRIC